MKIIINQEDYPENPLEDMDGGIWIITYLSRSRYILGNFPSDDDEIDRFARNPDYISLPVYTYTHGLTAMSVGRSWYGRLPQGHAEFDSGHSGYISISRKDARELYGIKRFTNKSLLRIFADMQRTVDAFCAYLNGDVYSMVAKDGNNEVYDCVTAYGYERRDEILADWLAEYPDAEVENEN